MKAELKAIPRDTVRRIYHDNYWQAAACPELPPGLALFHFDAAVNQGVAGAARMLQQAVGSEVDGEIGPLTLAAVASHPVDGGAGRLCRGPPPTLPRAADILALRQRLALPRRHHPGARQRDQPFHAAPCPRPTERPKTHAHRHRADHPDHLAPDAKWWGNSMTIQGIIVTTLSTVLPVLGPVLGLNITAELIHQLGDNVVTFAQAAGGLIGTIMAIYGRLRTSTPLERRQVTLSM